MSTFSASYMRFITSRCCPSYGNWIEQRSPSGYKTSRRLRASQVTKQLQSPTFENTRLWRQDSRDQPVPSRQQRLPGALRTSPSTLVISHRCKRFARTCAGCCASTKRSCLHAERAASSSLTAGASTSLGVKLNVNWLDLLGVLSTTTLRHS